MPRKKRYDRKGRPSKHPPILIVELGEVFPSYEAAAKRIGGRRACVYLCLRRMRRTHHGYSFEYVK